MIEKVSPVHQQLCEKTQSYEDDCQKVQEDSSPLEDVSLLERYGAGRMWIFGT